MAMAVQPKANAAGLGDRQHFGQVAQAVVVRLAGARGQADRIMDNEEARPRIKDGEQLAEAVALVGTDLAAGVPGNPVAGRPVDADEPDRPRRWANG